VGLEGLFDQVEHGRPLREHHDLALLGAQPDEQGLELREFARVRGRLLVDEECAVCRHSTAQQCLAKPEQVHLGQVRLAHDLSDDAHVAVMDLELLTGRRDPHELGGARRKLLQDRLASSAQQHRREPRAQLLEAVIAEHLASLVDDAVSVEEPEGRPQPAIVDELDHGVQLVEPVPTSSRSGW
jgi:hypothetical protein